MDFTLVRVSVEHQVHEVDMDVGNGEVANQGKEMGEGAGEEDEVDTLSQDFSQSSITDDSSIPGTQSTVASSTGGNMTEENPGGDGKDEDEAGFSVVFEENSPNSPYVSRPIFR